jgi:hypothetical protein
MRQALRESVRRELSLSAGSRRRRRRFLGILLGAAVGWIACGGAAAAQAPFRQELLAGFSSFQVNQTSSPELADLDADGDLDVVVGALDGTVRYYANLRNVASPLFVERTGTANPLGAVAGHLAAAPALADLDDDGDLDALLGEADGVFRYFENTGNAAAAAFLERQGTANPLAGFDIGSYSTPALGDLDGDGDLDAVAGNNSGVFSYFRNTGSAKKPAFAAAGGSANPFAGIHFPSGRVVPELADLDGDGDLDAIFGLSIGDVAYYVNSGTSSAPAFASLTGTANPLEPVDPGADRDRSSPELADFDGDGDLDLMVGELGGSLLYFSNLGSASSPAFVAVTGSSSPFDGIDLGYFYCRPELKDLDADGDLDALAAGTYGDLRFFANTGAAGRPAFAELTGSQNPFQGFVGINQPYPSPDLADVDADGDFDLVLGDGYGLLNLFRNTGSATLPSFAAAPASENPFGGMAFGWDVHPELADLDGDRDLDLLAHVHGEPSLVYFANTGSASAPAYSERTGSANPFAAIAPVWVSMPHLVDLDRDGDLDLALGDYFGQVRYFANTGTAAVPGFVEATGAANPFAGIDVVFHSSPQIADLDSDGDFDALVGEIQGRLVFHGSTLANVFADDFESGNLSAWSLD